MMEETLLNKLAYAAAYTILTTDFIPRELATPGAQRSKQLDGIADVIKEAMRGYTDSIVTETGKALNASYRNGDKRTAVEQTRTGVVRGAQSETDSKIPLGVR